MSFASFKINAIQDKRGASRFLGKDNRSKSDRPFFLLNRFNLFFLFQMAKKAKPHHNGHMKGILQTEEAKYNAKLSTKWPHLVFFFGNSG